LKTFKPVDADEFHQGALKFEPKGSSFAGPDVSSWNGLEKNLNRLVHPSNDLFSDCILSLFIENSAQSTYATKPPCLQSALMVANCYW
jgi:hypothetical protein